MRLEVAVRLVVTLVVACLVGWFAGTLLGLPSNQVGVTVALRSLLTLGIGVLGTRRVLRRTEREPGDRGAVLTAVVVGAVAGYLLFPPTWAGRALAGQLVLEPGVLTAVVDAVLWTASVVAAAYWGGARDDSPAAEPVPYAAARPNTHE